MIWLYKTGTNIRLLHAGPKKLSTKNRADRAKTPIFSHTPTSWKNKDVMAHKIQGISHSAISDHERKVYPPEIQDRYPKIAMFESKYIFQPSFLVSILDFGGVNFIFPIT